MRPGIGEDEVRFAAEALKASGRTVSIIAVREKLGGRGSYTTIKRHLDSMSLSTPWEQSTLPDLPPELLSSQTEALAVLWQSAIQSARKMLAEEIGKQASIAAEKDQSLTEATDEINRLEKALADRDDLQREQEITKRRLEDELVELRTELTSTKTHALELKASLESSIDREKRANERSEANSALLAEARIQLNHSKEIIEGISTEKNEIESKRLKLESQILTHQKELALSQQREQFAILETATIKDRCVALESELQSKQQELTMAVKSVDALRLGESELKEALAQGQATERELRARLSIESARLTKVEESLERLLKKATSEASGGESDLE